MIADKRRRRVWLAASCVVCAVLIEWQVVDLEGTEFAGGYITGKLLSLSDSASVLFLVAALLAFFPRRTASVVLLLASGLCLPLCVYSTAPGPFRWMFPGNYKTHPPANFVWVSWSAAIMVGVVLALCAAFAIPRSESPQS